MSPSFVNQSQSYNGVKIHTQNKVHNFDLMTIFHGKCTNEINSILAEGKP